MQSVSSLLGDEFAGQLTQALDDGTKYCNGSAHKHVVFSAFETVFGGQGLHTPLILACPYLHTHFLPSQF